MSTIGVDTCKVLDVTPPTTTPTMPIMPNYVKKYLKLPLKCVPKRVWQNYSESFKTYFGRFGGGGGSYGKSCIRMPWSLAEVNTCNAFSRVTSLWCIKFIFSKLVKMKFCNEMWLVTSWDTNGFTVSGKNFTSLPCLLSKLQGISGSRNQKL